MSSSMQLLHFYLVVHGRLFGFSSSTCMLSPFEVSQCHLCNFSFCIKLLSAWSRLYAHQQQLEMDPLGVNFFGSCPAAYNTTLFGITHMIMLPSLSVVHIWKNEPHCRFRNSLDKQVIKRGKETRSSVVCSFQSWYTYFGIQGALE